MNLANFGGTMTGGSSKTLTFSGSTAGSKASFITPDHSRTTPQTVDFLVTPSKLSSSKDPGVARSGLRVYVADRTTPSGCCDPQVGSVIIDVGLRWSLNQAETQVDEAIKYLQSLVFNTDFINGLKKGTLPSS